MPLKKSQTPKDAAGNSWIGTGRTVFDNKGNPHVSNSRAALRDVAERAKDQDPWFCIEQEYTMFQNVIIFSTTKLMDTMLSSHGRKED